MTLESLLFMVIISANKVSNHFDSLLYKDVPRKHRHMSPLHGRIYCDNMVSGALQKSSLSNLVPSFALPSRNGVSYYRKQNIELRKRFSFTLFGYDDLVPLADGMLDGPRNESYTTHTM
jgi:hypothetical protein